MPESQLSHIYISRHLGKGQLKLLCSNEWVSAKDVSISSHRNDGYEINGVHQWSIGAGHNADCPECIIKYAERKTKTDQILMNKLIAIAKGKICQ